MWIPVTVWLYAQSVQLGYSQENGNWQYSNKCTLFASTGYQGWRTRSWRRYLFCKTKKIAVSRNYTKILRGDEKRSKHKRGKDVIKSSKREIILRRKKQWQKFYIQNYSKQEMIQKCKNMKIQDWSSRGKNTRHSREHHFKIKHLNVNTAFSKCRAKLKPLVTKTIPVMVSTTYVEALYLKSDFFYVTYVTYCFTIH